MRTPRRALPGPTQNSSIDKPRPSLVNHQSRCTICKHRQREMIETAFLQWRSLTEIETEFKLTSRSTIYDHAHAFNLFERRARNLGFALDYFIQESEAIRLNARCVLRPSKCARRLTTTANGSAPPCASNCKRSIHRLPPISKFWTSLRRGSLLLRTIWTPKNFSRRKIGRFLGYTCRKGILVTP